MPILWRISGTWVSAAAFAISFFTLPLFAAEIGDGRQDDWLKQLRVNVNSQQFDAALRVVDYRLAQAPNDLEARGWHGRILAWQGHWAEAQSDYQVVLARVPNDVEILCALSDVLVWQSKLNEAGAVIDRARALAPRDSEVLLRRAHILRAQGDTLQTRRQYRELLSFDSENELARRELASLSQENRHELRIGTDVDTFNYTDAAQAESLLLTSRWRDRWSTTLGADFYHRFGEDAGRFLAGGSWRFTPHDWLSAGGSVGHDNGVIPKHDSFFEYGHGFRFTRCLIKGLEASYQQRWLWYRGAHVLTAGVTQLYYLPKDWTWALTLTGARSGFTGAGVGWGPSGATRLSFPLPARFSGNVIFAVGTENFAQVDQIGRFSARTYGGGLKWRFSPAQDLGGYIAVQDRTRGRAQNTYGLNYGFRF